MSETFAGVGAALGGQGAPCPTVTFCGTTWKIGWPTQDAKLWHELLVAQYAKEDLGDRKRLMSVKEYQRESDVLTTAFRGGHHRVGGSIWLSAVNGPDSMVLFLLSLLKEHQPNAVFTNAKVLWGAATQELRMAMAQVMPPFAKLLVETAPIPQEKKKDVEEALTALFLEQMPMENSTEPMPSSSPAPTD